MLNGICGRCTRLTSVVMVGSNFYCEPCFQSKLHDPDGKNDFIRLLDELGVIDIEA